MLSWHVIMNLIGYFTRKLSPMIPGAVFGYKQMSRDITKPTKWVSAQHPPSLIRVFAVRSKKAWVLSYLLSAQRRLWSDWVDAQTDLSLCWANTHFVGLVTSRLKFMCYIQTLIGIILKLYWNDLKTNRFLFVFIPVWRENNKIENH